MIKLIMLVLFSVLAFGCSARPDCSTEPEPACAPIEYCAQHSPGYSFAGLRTSKVGECTFYQYSCVRAGAEPSDQCEQLWETFCPVGASDASPGGGE